MAEPPPSPANKNRLEGLKKARVLQQFYPRALYNLDVICDFECAGGPRPIFRIVHEKDPENPIVSYHPEFSFSKLIERINKQRQELGQTVIPNNIRGFSYFAVLRED